MKNLQTEKRALPEGCVLSCPGCSHRQMTEADSIHQKINFLEKTLHPWREKIEPVQTPSVDQRLGYREKVILNTQWNGKSWDFGMIHREVLIPLPSCPVHSPMVNRILDQLYDQLPGPDLFPLAYYVQSRMQLTLVVKGKKKEKEEWLTTHLIEKLRSTGLEGLWIHYNPSAGRRIFEKTPRILLWGNPWSRDEHGMKYGPMAFQQLIPELYHRSLQEAFDWLIPSAQDAIIDLYCGTGNSMRYWSLAGASVAGVELGGDAVECALENVPAAKVWRGKCEERIPQMSEWILSQKQTGKKILVYANPPRTGIDDKTLAWIITEVKPERMVYLSCSAGTLGKNLIKLEAGGYSIEKITPYDFFPLTRHIETLSLLKRMD